MSERNIIQTSFDEFAQTAGFSKKSGSWYKRNDETIVVLNLQKSQYGPQYYVNVAIWLRALGGEDAPKANKCQIQTRLGQLVSPDSEKRLPELLDLKSAIDDTARHDEILRLLRGQLIPMIEAANSVDSLRVGVGLDLIQKSLVTGAGQQLLGITN